MAETATAPLGRCTTASPLLEVDGLCVEFRTERGWVRVVDDVSLRLEQGRTLGLVGESGSGKTVTSLAIMGLLPPRDARIPSGSIRLDGVELTRLSHRQLSEVRGERVSMIFQEPRRSLNPVLTVGHQIGEVYRRHRGVSRAEARRRAIEMLELVGIDRAVHRIDSYPHEFSGGMCQRVMLAIALACEPRLLIADEPTTALDVTVQAKMLTLMNDLQAELDLSILFITHDLGVVAEMCDEVAVMYAGQIVESAPLDDLFYRPVHPYTEGLLAAIPDASERDAPFRAIPGVVPPPWNFPAGCRFHTRCPYVIDGLCDAVPLAIEAVDDRRRVRCARAADLRLAGVEP